MTGPWHVAETFEEDVPVEVYGIYDAAGEFVGDTGYTGDADSRRANAVLMAAAPELLAACDLLLSVSQAFQGSARDAARAAVLKARG